MPDVLLFGEDAGHAVVLQALVERLATERRLDVRLHVRRARGGHGRMLTELAEFARHFERGRQSLPDLLLIGRDANCQGYAETKQAVEKALGGYPGPRVVAAPDPHVERWLLLDSAAFKKVLGKGCPAPDCKCEKDRYKRLLIQAIRAAGIKPLVGGIEYAEDLVKTMDLARVESADASLGRFLRDLRKHFNPWRQS